MYLRGNRAMYLAYHTFMSLWLAVTTRHPMGTNVFERDWDVLIILDSCRVDALRHVASNFDFVSDVDSIWSRGSNTREWTTHTFTNKWRDDIRTTVYVTSNGSAEEVFGNQRYVPSDTELPFDPARWDVVQLQDFELVDMVWKDSHDRRFGTVPPRAVTDRAIAVTRSTDFERLVIHYNQPHTPFVCRAIAEGRDPTRAERSPYESLAAGAVTRDALWTLYLENLTFVLDDIELLLENIDAETVVITADHGECLGEFGLYGHPWGVFLPTLRRVPWAETNAMDEQTYEPVLNDGDRDEVSVEEHLQDLGYLSASTSAPA